LWLLGGLGLLLAGAASIAAYRLRQAGGALAELQHPAVRHAPPAATILRNHPKGATV
jgi:hypothetical protein